MVDRRVVVDEAADRANALAACLATPPTDAIAKVADRLRAIADTESPLVVSTLRGGIPPDEDWAKTPTQPVVLLSTVDQVGSRVLFRAYGRHGPRSWPIHAGLLGRDTLIILDEAHCSRPFCQTVAALTDRYGSWAHTQVGRPARFVMMSGTASDEPDFRLEEIGERGDELEPRLAASKSARLAPVKSPSSDRAPLVERILVTECAALDSLRQRFGRLNRLGLQRKADAVIVGFEKPDDDDPVYGAALAKTWAYLWTNATTSTKKMGRKKVEERHVDFGVDALEALLSESPPEDGLAPLCAPTTDAPLLLPAHLDLLAQTNPPPDPTPDVGEFLHGLGSRSADVTIVWRADLTPGSEATWIDRVTVQPPSVGEGCQVPIWAARKWLESNATPDPFGDIEGQDQDYDVEDAAAGAVRRALRWRGSSDAALIRAEALRPGDVVIAPAAWGRASPPNTPPGSARAARRSWRACGRRGCAPRGPSSRGCGR